MFDPSIILFEQHQVLFLGTLFVLGSVVGSFLNVVIYRLPVMMQSEWKRDCLEFLEQATDIEAEKIQLERTSLSLWKLRASNNRAGKYSAHQLPGPGWKVFQLQDYNLAAIPTGRTVYRRYIGCSRLAFRRQPANPGGTVFILVPDRCQWHRYRPQTFTRQHNLASVVAGYSAIAVRCVR